MRDIDRTIDYCRGRIKSFEKALKPLAHEKFNQHHFNKNYKKLHHYKLMLKSLVMLRDLDLNEVYDVMK